MAVCGTVTLLARLEVFLVSVEFATYALTGPYSRLSVNGGADLPTPPAYTLKPAIPSAG